MSLYRTEAFVLRTYPLAEAHKICVFLTKDSGVLRGVAHGARKMKSRFGSALEPFTQVGLTYHENESRELMSVSTCDIVRSHFYLGARDVQTSTAFSYISELLIEFMPEREANERLYRLLGATLDAIEDGRNLTPTLRYFETWLLRLAGFFPDAGHCSSCDEPTGPDLPVFLAMDGTPRCQACSGGRGMVMSATLRGAISRILSRHPSSMNDGDIARRDAAELGEINYQIIRHALEHDLKSRSFLREFGAS